MDYKIRPMMLADYNAVAELWKNTEQLSLNECDTYEGIELYLNRNLGLCFVAEQGASLIGVVLCGHDGRRGFLRHLAVSNTHRGGGIARALVNKAMEGLAAQGIGKCNIFVEDTNEPGLKFWAYLGWRKLDDTFRTLQIVTRPNAGRNAATPTEQAPN